MKKNRVFATAGLVLLAAGVLAACSSSKSSDSSAPKAYGYVYTADPETLDYLISSKNSTTVVTSNGIDGLFTNDNYGNLAPAVAEDWEVSKDGLTYTYKIRKGVKWFTSDGEEYAEVTAKDFVNGLKHAADKKSEAMYLAENSVKGLADYLSGTSTDFSTVGVKAVDDYTLQYTLNQPEPFWNSKLTYSIFWPLNEEFETSKGSDFAKPTDPTSLLYNGPFLLKGLTAKSSVEFVKNEQYWDKENVHLDTINLAYYDGSDQESLERNFTSGAYSYARLYPTSSNYSKVAEEYKDNIYYTQSGSGIAGLGVNIDRQSYNYTSKTTDSEKVATKKALLNKDFRQALNFALDRSAYSAQINGKDGAALAVRNLFVKPDFVSAGEKTFGDLVAAQLPAYGDEWKGVNLADGAEFVNHEPVELTSVEIISPLTGQVKELSQATDPIFASGVMGQGLVIEPSQGELTSPVNGTVTVLFPTKHAIGIVSDEGVELLIHIGMDTVGLDGKGFESLVVQGDHVTVGQQLIRFDMDVIKAAGLVTETPVIITNQDAYTATIPGTYPTTIQAGASLMVATRI